jgi:hypothetical protein
MTRERFGKLLCGPLSHSLTPFTIARLQSALWSVVEATGGAGECALENWCADKSEQDTLEDLERWPTQERDVDIDDGC